MAGKLKWGILGTGNIAKALAKAIHESQTGELVAVGSRSQASADKFGDEFKVPAGRRYGSYQQLVDDPQVQVIYISLPNDQHAEWAIRCAKAGKHMLAEKPLTSNFGEAMAVVEAARENNVFLLEAFMYRAHPYTAKIVELVKSKVIGDVRFIEVHFSFDYGSQPDNIRSKASLSGGGIMDVGCYTMSFARIVAGAAAGKDGPAEPTDIKGLGHLEPNPDGAVDTWATATLKFPGDILANLVCGMQLNAWLPNQIIGTKGRIEVFNPWFPGNNNDAAKLVVHVAGEKEPRTIYAPSSSSLYAHEVDVVGNAINEGKKQAASPAMTWSDSLGNMKSLDRWRKEIGLVFHVEKGDGLKQTASKQPLKQGSAKAPKMAFGKIDGLDKPVSRLVIGTMSHVIGWQDQSRANAMLDRFFEMGGNAIDTAMVYGSEKVTGQWIRDRGVRNNIVLIAKGAASMAATPKMVTDELKLSLENFGLDHADVYMMHRDNTAVPIGEFVDVLNQHKKAGHIRVFGGSNWTTQRVQEFNDYAKSKGLSPMTVSSPNFALAEWNEPMWPGCCHAVSKADREWYRKSNVGLFAWSSQANGFFANRWTRADVGRPDLKEIERVWFNEGNWKRLDRVNELAKKKNQPPARIALSYVLSQPTNIYALIGPETMDEMRQSFEALELKLTPEETAWLNLEA